MTESSAAAREFQRLLDIMATLRAPDGCAWDREQTLDTLKPYVLEETYEVLEAIDRHDHASLCEELGDFVFEAVFLAQLETEAGHFSMADALKGVGDKLVRRHPHIFAREAGAPALDSPAAVIAQWDEIKAAERAGREEPSTVLGGVPEALPALLRADQISRRARNVGFDWVKTTDVLAKIEEEVAEVREVFAEEVPDLARAEEEVGDLLFAIASLARRLGIEPETALRKANAKFVDRFTAVERRVVAAGRQLRDMTLDELEAEWQQVKADAKAPPD